MLPGLAMLRDSQEMISIMLRAAQTSQPTKPQGESTPKRYIPSFA